MLLEVENVYKSYRKSLGFMKKGKSEILKGVSLKLRDGECLGIIGESGSGKSTLGRLIMGIEKADSGRIRIESVEINKKHEKDFKKKISLVFQDYSSSVNPSFRVKDIIAEPIKKFEKLSKVELVEKTVALLNKVGLSKEHLNRYPHELSGGQLQRVCIARAISTNPKLLVLDEAISSLDVSIQVQVLDLLLDLKKELGLSYVFITHDITATTYICDRVLFFKEGQVVEEVASIDELKNVKKEYSRELLGAAIMMNEGEMIYE